MWWMFWDEKLHNKATIKGKRIDFMSRFAWFRNCLLFVFIYLRAGWRTWRDIIPSQFESKIMQTKESEGWFILSFCSKGILLCFKSEYFYYLMLGIWRDVVPSQIMPRKASDTSSETKNRKQRETSTEGEMQCLFPYFIGPYISTDIAWLIEFYQHMDEQRKIAGNVHRRWDAVPISLLFLDLTFPLLSLGWSNSTSIYRCGFLRRL